MKRWFPLILALVLCLMCTAAMAECEHDNETRVPNADGTHSYICDDCSTETYREECADFCDDSDSACDWCGSTAGEANNYHFNNPTCKVEGGKHVVTCGCGVVVGSYEPRAYDNGDDMFHAMGCSYCFGMNGEPEFHTGLGSGTDNGDGTCSFTCVDCGYTYTGEHLAAMGGGDGFHGTSCYYCNTWTWKEDCYEECYNADGECDECGASVSADKVRHDYADSTCDVSGGKHVRTCTVCNKATVSNDVVCWKYDDTFHMKGCHYCLRNGEGTAEQKFHGGSGTDNGDGTCTFSCSDCDYSYTGTHKDAMSGGDGFHGTNCYYCNTWTWKEDCSETCTDKDGECDTCGSSDLTVIHGETTSTISGGKCNHVCSGCGETVEAYDVEWIPEEARPSGKTGHFAECSECGKEGANETPHTYKYTTTADDHQAKCTVCGWKETKEAHVYTNDDDLDCDVCGLLRECDHDCETVCTANGSKHDVACARCGEALKSVALTWGYTEDGHYTECAVCGEVSAEEAHTITYKKGNADHAAKCDICGYEAAAEEHVYADEEDNDCDVCGNTKQCQHTYWYTVRKQATCTEDGIRVDYCNLCGKEHSTQAIPAKGHNLSTEDMGDYILESCSRCDYQNKIEKHVEQPVEEAPVVDGLQVTEEDETVALPENVNAAKVFTVAMMKDGQAIQPEEATTVTLAFTEEEMAAIEGLKLVLILEDGTMVEVPYEVIEGQIIFTAEQLGVFAFVAE